MKKEAGFVSLVIIAVMAFCSSILLLAFYLTQLSSELLITNYKTPQKLDNINYSKINFSAGISEIKVKDYTLLNLANNPNLFQHLNYDLIFSETQNCTGQLSRVDETFYSNLLCQLNSYNRETLILQESLQVTELEVLKTSLIASKGNIEVTEVKLEDSVYIIALGNIKIKKILSETPHEIVLFSALGEVESDNLSLANLVIIDRNSWGQLPTNLQALAFKKLLLAIN